MNYSSLGFMSVMALMLTMLLTPLSIKFARILNVVDAPGTRKVHVNNTPRLGGLAFSVSLLVSVLLFLPMEEVVKSFLVGMVMIAIIGIADDLLQIRPGLKFIGEILASLAFILLSGATINNFGDLFGTGQIYTGSFAIPITVFCMVGVINALNLSDGLDGLAGGLSAIACLFLAYFAIISGNWICLAIIAGLFGSLMGFLYFNSHPAMVFMGDTGSLVLGYSLSAICILLVQQGNGDVVIVKPISMALILGLPIVDTLLVMTRRLVHGYSPFSADKTHLHHRLMSLNLPHSGVVPVMLTAMFLFGLWSVIMHDDAEWLQFLTGVIFASMLFVSVAMLQHFGFKIPHQWQMNQANVQRTRLFNVITKLMGKSIPVMTWLIPVSLIVPTFFLTSLTSDFIVVPLIIGMVILILFPWQASSERVGWVHGLIYIITFILLAMLNFFGSTFVVQYLKAASLVVVLWVVLKLVFKRHGRVFLTSGFELLMIFISWFIPLILVPALDMHSDAQRLLVQAGLEAIPFLLAMKILIRRQPRRNISLIGCLISAFFLIGIRALTGL